MDISVDLTEDSVSVRITDVHPVNSDTARDIAADLVTRLHRTLNEATHGDG